MEIYQEGRILDDDEFLLKLDTVGLSDDEIPTGFLAKLTKKGGIPVSLDTWRNSGWMIEKNKNKTIYVHTERFQSGWKIFSYRPGQSQQWAEMIHPDGFYIEIYLSDFFELLETVDIKQGVLQGEFKWEKHTLIQRK